MSAVVDIRSTLGWRLCPHARTAARHRQVARRDILTVVADPEVTYTAYDYGPGRRVFQRGDLAVVTVPEKKVIVTILWRQQAQWTDQEFATRQAG